MSRARRGSLLLPQMVKESIGRHIKQGCRSAVENYFLQAEDEDSLTGALSQSLSRPAPVTVVADGGRWKWSLTVTKLRGRGPAAEERIVGADGMFQIVVGLADGEQLQKGLLFQAKKGGNQQGLVEQCRRMEDLAPGGCAVFEYNPDGYRGTSAARLYQTDEVALAEWSPLEHYLGDQFLDCTVGRVNLYHEYATKTLFVPEANAGYRRVRVEIGRRFQIKVTEDA